ncbi:MAG: hypothetical protein ACRDHY_02065, partial [Anaerolineales bacterium]
MSVGTVASALVATHPPIGMLRMNARAAAMIVVGVRTRSTMLASSFAGVDCRVMLVPDGSEAHDERA